MSHAARLCLMSCLCLAALGGGRGAHAQAVPPKPGPSPALYARAYAEVRSPAFRKNFPSLSVFEVLAPSTPGAGKKGGYNCIAHTLRVYNRWVWPGKQVADFDRLYGSHGYRRVRTLDYRFHAQLDKVVLYAKRLPGGGWECTHGARQLADGTWTSKLGAGPLIRHPTPEAVAGPSYGRPVAVYVRRRRAAVVTPPETTRIARAGAGRGAP
jgi:hypothetical protein